MKDTFVVAQCAPDLKRENCRNCTTIKHKKEEVIKLYQTWSAGTRQPRKYAEDMHDLRELDPNAEFICAGSFCLCRYSIPEYEVCPVSPSYPCRA